jgi:hypothetical protein
MSDGLQRAGIAADYRPPFHSTYWLSQELRSAPASSGGAAVNTSGANALMVAPALSRSALPADHLKRVQVVKLSRALGDTSVAAEQAKLSCCSARHEVNREYPDARMMTQCQPREVDYLEGELT